MGFSFVLEQIGVLSIVLLIGFLISKTGYVKAGYREGISKLIVNVLLPCLIISSITKEDLSPDLMAELGIVFLMSVFCIGTLFLLGIFTAKLFRIPNATRTVHKLMMCMGNVIFVGYPIIVAMYGEESFVYAIIYWLLNDLFLWTVGVFMLGEKKNQGILKNLGKLFNPDTIAFAVAIVMLCFGIKLPSILQTTLSGIGGLTTYLSMIFIGMTLSTVKIKSALKKWWVFPFSILKLIVMPIIFLAVFRLLGIGGVITGVVVLEAAMPAQTVLTILASENGSDAEYAAVGMFVSTILSLVTLPFISYVLQAY